MARLKQVKEENHVGCLVCEVVDGLIIQTEPKIIWRCEGCGRKIIIIPSENSAIVGPISAGKHKGV